MRGGCLLNYIDYEKRKTNKYRINVSGIGKKKMKEAFGNIRRTEIPPKNQFTFSESTIYDGTKNTKMNNILGRPAPALLNIFLPFYFYKYIQNITPMHLTYDVDEKKKSTQMLSVSTGEKI